MRSINTQQEQVFVVSSDGSNNMKITDYGALTPDWSPNDYIGYIHYHYSKKNLNNGTIWIMKADGSNKKQLTYNHGLVLN